MGPDHGYHLIYIPLCNSTPRPAEPYHGVNTHDKEIKLYGVSPRDYNLIEHFLRKADAQYAHVGHYDSPCEQGRPSRQQRKTLGLEERIKKLEQSRKKKFEATPAA